MIYVLIGWVAILVALGKTKQQADQRGALQLLSGKPYGLVSLWLLCIGFAAYALWPRLRSMGTARATADRWAALSARTIARRLSSVSGLYAYLVARGDTPVHVNPVPGGKLLGT